MLAIYWISCGWRCIALMSGYICRFYDEDVKILKMIDEDVKILKMIYIKNDKKKIRKKNNGKWYRWCNTIREGALEELYNKTTSAKWTELINVGGWYMVCPVFHFI